MSITITQGGADLQSSLAGNIQATAGSVIAYAHDRAAAVDTFVQNLASQVLSLVAPTISPEFPSAGLPPAVEIPTPPTFTTPVWTAPGMPAAFTAVLDTGDLGIDPFDGAPPTLNFGTPPPAHRARPDRTPAVDLDFDDPTLVVNLPAPPPLLSLDVERFDGVNLPTFDADAPVLTAVEPSIREYRPGDLYTSPLLETLRSTLQDRIISGGTGLTPDVENAIWDRGREREALSQRDALAQLDQMEELGYALPPGAYLDARVKIITESDYAQRGASREIMIKSSELMLDNVKMAIQVSVDLEGKLLDYTNSVEQRFFDASKYATEAGIAIYNAKVQAFSAMVDVYRAKVQIYQALIQGEQAKVDVYKATIEAEQAKASINQTMVDQYKVLVDVALSNVEIYKAEIAGIQTKAEIEKTKVDIFGAQVQGYTAQINAYTAGVEGWRALVQGEATKQDAYKSQVDAYTARVGATSAIIDARVKAFEGQVSAYSATLDGYRATIAGESARVDAITKVASVQADAYKSTVEAVGSYNDVLTKQWQAAIDENLQAAQVGIQAAKANADLYVSTRSLALDATKTGAQVAAQLGAAAINAVNFSNSVSASESVQGSAGISQSFSQSTSTGTSTSTNYNYSESQSV